MTALREIPIGTAKRIASEFGYDQVIIFARKCGEPGSVSGEHLTTYGVSKAHCDVAARIGEFLKHKIMGWVKEDEK